MTGQNVVLELSRLTGEKRAEALMLARAAIEDLEQARRVKGIDDALSAECEGAAHGYAFKLREMLYDAK